MSDTFRLPRIERFPIEAGHIQLFKRAIGDSSAGDLIAPPTFSEASNHFDADWPYRPRWQGSDSAPSTEPRERGTDMHAETHFVYHRPMHAGMVLAVRARLGRQWTKHGQRSGELKFHEIVAEFADATGAQVLQCTTVVLSTERKVAAMPAPASTPSTQDVHEPKRVTRGVRLASGDRFSDVLVRNLSRAQIVQYAGASGDFSPQHVDEAYNTQVAGYPSVFAHGMLTMGMTGRALTDLLGEGRLRTFGFQFRQQVWPGDSLEAAIEITAISETSATAELSLSVTNQHRQVVGKGYATALLNE